MTNARKQGTPKATITTTKGPKVATKVATKNAMPDKADAEAKTAATSVEFAGRMARLFDDTKSTFDRAKLSHAAVAKGASLAIVADELSMIRAKAAYPEATDIELDYYASNVAGKGGTQISKASLHAYASAWASIIAAGIDHDVEVVGLAFRLYSKGGTANGRKEAERRCAGMDDKTAARSEYVRAAHLNLRGVNPYDITPAKASTASADDVDGADVAASTVSHDGFTVGQVVSSIESWAKVTWSSKDRDAIMDAFTRFVEATDTPRSAKVADTSTKRVKVTA